MSPVLFQIKALQTNFFITHLIDILQEDQRRFGEDTSTIENSITLSSYEEYSESAGDSESLSWSNYGRAYQQAQAQPTIIDIEGVEFVVTAAPETPPRSLENSSVFYEQNRTLFCTNHSGMFLSRGVAKGARGGASCSRTLKVGRRKKICTPRVTPSLLQINVLKCFLSHYLHVYNTVYVCISCERGGQKKFDFSPWVALTSNASVLKKDQFVEKPAPK